MLRKVVVLLVMVCMCFEYAYAESDYPYKSVCPPNAGYNPDMKERNVKIMGGKLFAGDQWLKSYTDKNGVFHDLNYWKDSWNFAQCNCTSYVASVLRDPFDSIDNSSYDPIYGIDFKNDFLQPSGKAWSHGGRWGDAARRANIAVDKRPLPGDAVYFTGGSYGHIAYVEHVDYDSDMNWERIYISEYNVASPGTYGTREITPSSTGFPNKPAGFIHLRAVINPEFYFNYYDLGYDFAGQTKEEWEYIFALVMRNYYDANRDPKYASAFNQVWNSIGRALPIGFGGGNGGESSGGTWQPGGPYPGGPSYGNDSWVPNADVSIRSLEIKGPGQSNHHTESGAIFYPGQTQSVDLKGKIKNKSNDNTDQARLQSQ